MDLHLAFRLPWEPVQPDTPTPLGLPWLRPPPPVVVSAAHTGVGAPGVLVAFRSPPRVALLLHSTSSADADDPHSLPSPLRQASLLAAGTRVATGRRPVALAVGTSGDGALVVVVVTEKWGVQCFDGKLQRVWETTANHLQDRYGATKGHLYHREVGVAVEGNLVVVAGSMDHVHRAKDALAARMDGRRGHGHGPDSTEELQQDATDDAEDQEQHLAEERHFSFYAFDVATGQVVWKHDGVDMDEEVFGAEVTQPQHRYAMHVSNADHREEAKKASGSWRLFRRSMLHQLPHAWAAREDTALRAATFARAVTGRRKEEWSARDGSDQGEPGALSELVRVVVAHSRSGVEAVNMATGQPVAHLSLAPGAVHADVNADNVMDTVEVVSPRVSVADGTSAGLARLLPSCLVRVRSGVPARSVLWSTTACGASMSASGAIVPPARPRRQRKAAAAFAPASDLLDVDMATPAVVRHERVGTGGWTMATVVHVSSGWVSAVDHKGAMLWQTLTDAGWLTRNQPHADTVFLFAALQGEPASMTTGFLLVVGETHCCVVRAVDGKVVASWVSVSSAVVCCV